MLLRLPKTQADLLRDALAKAGTREIGGQLFGEQLAPSDFRVSELVIQRRHGTVARFFVDLLAAARAGARFFEKTGHRYKSFNYIGEWHSHPSFAVQPSGTDIGVMQGLVSDSLFNGTFAALMIVRLDGDQLRTGAWVFDRQGGPESIELKEEQ